MNLLRRNLIANFGGQFWSALTAFLFIPVYIRLLGVEAFGLIAFYGSLQVLAFALDFGLAGTINRELARRRSESAEKTRNLARSLEAIYWLLGVLVGLVVWSCAGAIARIWLRPAELNATSVEFAVGLMGVTIGAQWPAAFYAAGLNGLQRQVLSNGLAAAIATVRWAGVLLPLVLVSPTIETFFMWQVAASVLQTLVYAHFFWGALPRGNGRARFSLAELRSVGRFALGLGGGGIAWLLLTQSDRIVLSRLLSLEQFGTYALGASVAAFVLRLVQPWFNVMLPRFAELHARGEASELRLLYHASSQWLAVTLVPIGVWLAFFSGPVLRVWTADVELARTASPVLAALGFGMMLNGLMNLPYALQLAHGWTGFSLWANSLGVLLLVPCIAALAKAGGPAAAALAWPALNIVFVIVGPPIMHRFILKGELRNWYVRDTGWPLLATLLAGLLLWNLVGLPEGRLSLSVVLGIVLFVLFVVCVAVTPQPRRALVRVMTARTRSRW